MAESTADDPERGPAAPAVRRAGEVVLGLLGFGTAWPFGSVDAVWEAVATGGVALLTLLWAAHAGLTRRLRLRFDAPALILSGLILLSGLQLVPLPAAVVGFASPAAVRWNGALRPASAELLPGETAAVARPTSFPISLDPTATRLFACRLAALLAVYLAARNWLATRASSRRLAWAGLLSGVALSTLALGQYFSSPPNVIYWEVSTAGAVFGPFVCRNHYPDYIALCAGLGIAATGRGARDVLTAPLQLLQRPAVLAALAGVGMMLASIPFSHSRGGMLAVAVAGVGAVLLARRRAGSRRMAVALAAFGVLAVAVWFGFAHSPDDRTPLWKSSFDQLPGFWLGGAGNGTHLRIEPLGRADGPTVGSPNAVAEHAHNEYLEAAVEGGLPRLALTVALPTAVLLALARGFRRHRAPASLGAWFGLAVVAAHAFTDFALHIPAVALLAVTVTAFGMADANRRRRENPPSDGVPALPPPTWRGWPAVALAGTLALAMLLLTWDARRRYLGDRYLAAGMERGRSTDPDANRRRIDLLRASAAADPRNPDAHFQLAQAHLDAAHDLGPLPAEAVAGPILPRHARPARHSPAMIEQHIVPALGALRTARDLCPLVAEVHARLGLLAGYCDRSERALVHLERAKLLSKSDPGIRFACGLEALRAGDRAAALADWKRALQISPKVLRPILRAARPTMTPDEILGDLLPDDPVLLVGAADELYPDHRTHRAARRPFLERAAEGTRPDATASQWIATAQARGELDRIADARLAWENAIGLDPGRAEPREGLARLLESDELYAEALPHLEWLSSRRPHDPDLKLRRLAARHGAELDRRIGK